MHGCSVEKWINTFVSGYKRLAAALTTSFKVFANLWHNKIRDPLLFNFIILIIYCLCINVEIRGVFKEVWCVCVCVKGGLPPDRRNSPKDLRFCAFNDPEVLSPPPFPKLHNASNPPKLQNSTSNENVWIQHCSVG